MTAEARPLRSDVARVDVAGETLLLDPAAGVLVRLPTPRASDDAALAELGLVAGAAPLARRDLMRVAGLLGVAVVALPDAAAATSLAPFTASTGTVEAFDANIFDSGGSVNDIVVRDDGSILVVGDFGRVGDVYLANVALLDADGTLDGTFSTTYSDLYTASGAARVALDADGTLLVGADYSNLLDLDTNTIVEFGHPLFAVTAAGTVSAFVSNGVSEDFTSVSALAEDATGRILVGGYFENIGGVEQRALARLHPNGVVDTSFRPELDVNADVRAIAVTPVDGRILIGGDFTQVGGTTRYYAARLHTNGALDTDFDPDLDGNVEAIALDGGGGVLLGGSFSLVGWSGESAVDRVALARFHANGDLDTDFDARIVGFATVHAIAVQPDGRIVIGGDFTELGGVGGFDAIGRDGLARLHANGDVDETLANVALDGGVRAVVVEESGSLLIGGTFTNVGGEPRTYLARIT